MVRGLYTLLAALTLALPAAATATGSNQDGAVLREMNRVRTAHGLVTLRFDDHLQRAAVSHSADMLTTNVFTHGAFGSRLLQFDVQSSVAGENLAWGTGRQGTARAIVAAWLASPEHRANLLRPSFDRVGIGALTGRFLGHRGALVVTADFAG